MRRKKKKQDQRFRWKKKPKGKVPIEKGRKFYFSDPFQNEV
jgi:hypothetical protein